MKQKNKFFASILLATTFLSSGGAMAAHTPKEDFTNVISFGDSFTIPDNSWAALITQRYGFEFVHDKNNFVTATTFNLADQYKLYKNNNGDKVDPHALYQSYTGVNDMELLHKKLENYEFQMYEEGYEDRIRNHPNLLPPLVEVMNGIRNLTIISEGDKRKIRRDVAAEAAAGKPNNYLIAIATMSLLDMLQDYNGMTIKEIMSSISMPLPELDSAAFQKEASDYLAEIATAKANWVKTLHDDGVKHIVLLNHYNQYYSQYMPGDTDEEDKNLGEKESKEYNKAMYEAMDRIAPGANVTFVDYDRLVEEVSSDPKAYFGKEKDIRTFRGWGFFTRLGGDPTPAAQELTKQLIASILEAPARVAMVRELPIAVGTNALQTIHTTAHNSVLHPTEQFYTSEVGGDYIYNHTKIISKKELGIKKANTGVAHATINYKINENFSLGLQLNGAKSKMDFQKDHGKADIKEYLVSINGTYKFNNPVFIYAAFGAGQIKYNIKRKITLGLATREERGKPSGVHYIGTVGIGYNYLDESQLAVTPFVNVNYQEVSLKTYKEIGDIRSTTMEFNIPNRKSLMPEVGVTISKDCKVQDNLTLIPSLSLSYGHECIKSIKKEAKIKTSDNPRTSSLPTYKVDESNFMVSGELRAKNDTYLNYGVRASMQLTKRAKQYSAGLFAGFSF